MGGIERGSFIPTQMKKYKRRSAIMLGIRIFIFLRYIKNPITMARMICAFMGITVVGY